MKATKGAWWKSTIGLFTKEADNAEAPDQPVDQQPPMPESGETSGPQKKTAPQKESANVPDEPVSDSAPRKRVQKKPAGRRTRKPAPKQPENKSADAGDETVPTRQTEKITLLINADEPEECRIAQVEKKGRVELFHVSTMAGERIKNNIYKGVVSAVEPNLQAAFIDIGLEKNGFLPFGDIHPEYYDTDLEGENLEKLLDTHWKKLKIQELIRPGQKMLVQVVKETGGSKGPHMTTYLSIPGRNLVLMPGSDSTGISRKIEDESQRGRLREIMASLSVPEGIGYIVRTASLEITKTSLQKDLRFLLRLWNTIKEKGQAVTAPALVYKDQDLIGRFLRDYFDNSITEIITDTQEAYEQVLSFMKMQATRQHTPTIKLHQDSRPLFSCFGIEKQIEQIYQPTVQLPSGGSIVINPTEALVAIDVNSGRTGKDHNFEDTIFLANSEAAVELARQLRLRDLGGLIVVDFIDMRSKKNTQSVEKTLRDALKRDKAKCETSTISKFGLMQISRQKMGSPIEKGSYNVCPHCEGRGTVRSTEAQALIHLRRLQFRLAKKNIARVRCLLPVEVALYLLNRKKEDLLELEKHYEVEINVEGRPEMRPTDHDITFFNQAGEVVKGG